jgi:hypothetical protein
VLELRLSCGCGWSLQSTTKIFSSLLAIGILAAPPTKKEVGSFELGPDRYLIANEFNNFPTADINSNSRLVFDPGSV